MSYSEFEIQLNCVIFAVYVISCHDLKVALSGCTISILGATNPSVLTVKTTGSLLTCKKLYSVAENWYSPPSINVSPGIFRAQRPSELASAVIFSRVCCNSCVNGVPAKNCHLTSKTGRFPVYDSDKIRRLFSTHNRLLSYGLWEKVATGLAGLEGFSIAEMIKDPNEESGQLLSLSTFGLMFRITPGSSVARSPKSTFMERESPEIAQNGSDPRVESKSVSKIREQIDWVLSEEAALINWISWSK